MAATRKKALTRDAAIERGEEFLAGHGDTLQPFIDEYRRLLESYRRLVNKLNKVIVISDTYQNQSREAQQQLGAALDQLNRLREIILPICMFCKKIRGDNNYWERIETYFSHNIDIMFSHGICPDCMEKKYGAGLDRKKVTVQLASEVQKRVAGRKAQPAPAVDEHLRAMQALLEDPAVHENPLAEHLKGFSQKYGKLLLRLNKILVISDAYQAQLQEMNMTLEKATRTDLLTGIANRQDILEKMETELNRSQRHGSVFSVLLLDIDNYKLVNDNHGHDAGDMVLVEVAANLHRNVRKEDTCARWGGDEFLILLPETDAASAEVVGQKLLAEVRGYEYRYRDTAIHITFSAGVATFAPGLTIDDCIRDADRSMYAAKQQGKDRLVIAEQQA